MTRIIERVTVFANGIRIYFVEDVLLVLGFVFGPCRLIIPVDAGDEGGEYKSGAESEIPVFVFKVAEEEGSHGVFGGFLE